MSPQLTESAYPKSLTLTTPSSLATNYPQMVPIDHLSLTAQVCTEIPGLTFSEPPSEPEARKQSMDSNLISDGMP